MAGCLVYRQLATHQSAKAHKARTKQRQSARLGNRRGRDAGLTLQFLKREVSIFLFEFENLRGRAGDMHAVDGRREGARELVQFVRDLGPGSGEVIREENRSDSVHVDVEDSAIERAA